MKELVLITLHSIHRKVDSMSSWMNNISQLMPHENQHRLVVPESQRKIYEGDRILEFLKSGVMFILKFDLCLLSPSADSLFFFWSGLL